VSDDAVVCLCVGHYSEFELYKLSKYGGCMTHSYRALRWIRTAQSRGDHVRTYYFRLYLPLCYGRTQRNGRYSAGCEVRGTGHENEYGCTLHGSVNQPSAIPSEETDRPALKALFSYNRNPACSLHLHLGHVEARPVTAQCIFWRKKRLCGMPYARKVALLPPTIRHRLARPR
jgi:hypothetical protein